MRSSHIIKARVTEETKRIVESVAREQQITESAWLRRLVDTTLKSAGAGVAADTKPQKLEARATRVRLRIRPDDLACLRERAASRGMPAATYVAVLVRSHLRGLNPLPQDELLALKRTVREVRALGQNLNQLARAANAGQPVGVRREDLWAILKACEALRDHVRGLIKANLLSWESGFDAADH
jgi:predicted DNA binding CopG/RHH family protein